MAVRPIDAVQVLHNINLRRRPTPVSEFESGFNDGLNQAMWEITRAPTLTQPNEWVSVEDRLPRVGGNYICAVQDKNGGKWTIPSEWNLEMKTWFGAFGEIKNKVTHWMPLPAPPDRRLPEGEDK